MSINAIPCNRIACPSPMNWLVCKVIKGSCDRKNIDESLSFIKHFQYIIERPCLRPAKIEFLLTMNRVGDFPSNYVNKLLLNAIINLYYGQLDDILVYDVAVVIPCHENIRRSCVCIINDPRRCASRYFIVVDKNKLSIEKSSDLRLTFNNCN